MQRFGWEPDTPRSRSRIHADSSPSHSLPINLVVKCEFFNAGGSVKDRIAKKMLEEAEATGVLEPGKSVIVEPTSGNTGVGLALACAIRGYRCVIVLPEKMSQEKVTTLRALGAEVVRTPTEAAWDDPRSNIMVARRLATEIPNAHILDQYNNPNNPLAHKVTAEEIIEALGNSVGVKKGEQNSLLSTGQENRPLTPALTPDASPPMLNTQLAPNSVVSSSLVDVLACGVGTGGTISGIASRLKESDHNPSLHVVGIDPVGSSLAVPASLNELKEEDTPIYKIEGIGYDFDPKSLDKNQIDSWIKTRDEESFEKARDLIRLEGLLAGGSSGAVLAGAVRWLQTDGFEKYGSQEGKNVVVVLPDR